jgi:hypothetical protein
MFGFGRGGDAGGVDPLADLAASSRDLFFPTAVFMLFDGKASFSKGSGFSLAFVRGLCAEASSGGARGSTVYGAVAVCTGGELLARFASSGYKCGGMKNPKGFGFYL